MNNVFFPPKNEGESLATEDGYADTQQACNCQCQPTVDRTEGANEQQYVEHSENDSID